MSERTGGARSDWDELRARLEATVASYVARVRRADWSHDPAHIESLIRRGGQIEGLQLALSFMDESERA